MSSSSFRNFTRSLGIRIGAFRSRSWPSKSSGSWSTSEERRSCERTTNVCSKFNWCRNLFTSFSQMLLEKILDEYFIIFLFEIVLLYNLWKSLERRDKLNMTLVSHFLLRWSQAQVWRHDENKTKRSNDIFHDCFFWDGLISYWVKLSLNCPCNVTLARLAVFDPTVPRYRSTVLRFFSF